MTDPSSQLPGSELLTRLRSVPDEELATRIWVETSRAERSLLFQRLAIAADLPRLAEARVLDRRDAREAWPELLGSLGEVRRLQSVVDHPILPDFAVESVARTLADPEGAREELAGHHCVTVEGLLEPEERLRLDARIEAAREEKPGIWKGMDEEEEPELWEIFSGALARPAFEQLTGWRPDRDEFSLTLSLQSLDRAGIGWHRDLYWPREWVGQDVFAVLYALGSDSVEKGGAFAYWVPWEKELRFVHRRHHQATILWNSADDAGRILHAVTEYHGEDTSRHLVILQCCRKGA